MIVGPATQGAGKTTKVVKPHLTTGTTYRPLSYVLASHIIGLFGLDTVRPGGICRYPRPAATTAVALALSYKAFPTKRCTLKA